MRLKFVAAVTAIGFGVASAAVVISGTSATAQEPPGALKVRAQLMKMNGAAMGIAGKMVQGEEPYDAAKAAEAMAVIARDMEAFPKLFPAEGSEGAPTADEAQAAIDELAAAVPDLLEQAAGDDGQTRAKDDIWSDFAGFQEIAAKTVADAKAAEAAAADGLDSFKTAFAAVGQDCGACHETYRGPRP